jgi:hypothetical protein
MGAESRCIGDRFGTVTPGDLFSLVTSDEGNGPRAPPCVAASTDGNPSEVHKVTRSVTQRGSTVELSSTSVKTLDTDGSSHGVDQSSSYGLFGFGICVALLWRV